MALTTIQIIKILPFEDAFKKKLLDRLETVQGGERMVFVDALWDMYDTVYQIRLEKNLTLARMDLEEGIGEISPEFFIKVEEKTNKEMQEEAAQEITDVDLSQARGKLEEIMNGKKN